MEIVFVVLISGFVLGLYFLPFIVALCLSKRNKAGIFILNLFLGWTLLGWVGALVWAVCEQRKLDTGSI